MLLNSILLIVGIVALAAAFGLYVLPKFILRNKNEATGKTKGIVPFWFALVLTAIGLLGVFSNGLVYYAEPGFNYLVQYPTGHQIGELKPGYHLKAYGSTEPFKKFITVKATNNPKGLVSAEIPPISVRFTDTVLADVEVTARFAMPTNADKFLALAISFRTQDNFEDSTLIPVLREVTRNAARTMTAQDYIAGRGGEFENGILDQLREGTYILKVNEFRPTNTSEITTDEPRTIDNAQMVRYEVEFQYNEDGSILRKPTALKDYGVTTPQSNVASVDPEEKFKEMLGKQRDAAAEASVKKQEAKRAEYDKQKIIAEGEASKAAIKVTLEQEQIRILITAETSKKGQEIALEEAKLRLKQVTVDATARKTAADAEAYEKKALVMADGALGVKADIIKHIATVWSKGWSERDVSQTVISSGGGNGDGTADNNGEFNTFMNMMLVEQAKKLNLDMSLPKGANTK